MDKTEPKKKALEPRKYEAFHVWKTAEGWSKDGHCIVTLKVLQARLDKGWTIRQAMEIHTMREELDG